jgi:hypothetical protein
MSDTLVVSGTTLFRRLRRFKACRRDARRYKDRFGPDLRHWSSAQIGMD